MVAESEDEMIRKLNQLKVFRRPFVKRFTLSYWTVVCLSVLSCLSVTLVYCGQTVEWFKMKRGMEVGLGPGHIVLDGDPAPPQNGAAPAFRPLYCGQVAGWINMQFGMEVGLGPGHIVLNGDPAPQFSGHVCCSKTA